MILCKHVLDWMWAHVNFSFSNTHNIIITDMERQVLWDFMNKTMTYWNWRERACLCKNLILPVIVTLLSEPFSIQGFLTAGFQPGLPHGRKLANNHPLLVFQLLVMASSFPSPLVLGMRPVHADGELRAALQ